MKKIGRARRHSVAKSAAAKHHTYTHRHKKPYRIEHVGLLLLSLLFTAVLILEVGVIIGRSKQAPVADESATQTNQQSLTVVRSSLGFSFGVDVNTFTVNASALDEKGNTQSVAQNELRDGKQIVTTTIKPQIGKLSGPEAAVQFNFQISADSKTLDSLKAKAENTGKSGGELAALIFPVNSVPNFDIAAISSNDDNLDGVIVKKTIYQYTSKFGANTNTYEVDWTGVLNGKPFVLRLQGLVGGSNIPASFLPIFDTLNLSGSQKVESASTFLRDALLPKASAASKGLDSKYISDLVSPSVVKIYHIVCYAIEFGGQEVIQDGCDGGTGSGFLITADGYIATNGHVIDSDPQGLLVSFMLRSPTFFVGFLRAAGLTDAQIAQVIQSPQLLADIITKIYELPEGTVKLKNKRESIIVALGNESLTIKSLADLGPLVDSFTDKTSIKKAELIGSDYSSKDLHVNLYTDKGFTSNDVALLKIKVDNAPALTIADSARISQNQKLLLIGYPGDADNGLVKSGTLNPTVTNGTVSSIRDAAGNSGKLFQSDADASQGNSGGPAVTEEGDVFGLLTYRYQQGQGNAAKSYIRDIKGLQDLAKDKSVTISSASKSQAAWSKGLTLFSQNHYSKAVKEFDKVSSLYPAHRLVGSYIAQSKEAIAAGKNVKDFPILILAIGLGIGGVGIAIAVVLIARHRAHHQMYMHGQAAGMPPAQGPAPGPTPVSMPTTIVVGGSTAPTVQPQVVVRASAPSSGPTVVPPAQQPPKI